MYEDQNLMEELKATFRGSGPGSEQVKGQTRHPPWKPAQVQRVEVEPVARKWAHDPLKGSVPHNMGH